MENTMQFVSNASPIIFLVKLDLIHILPRLSDKLIIPEGVYHEIKKGDDAAWEWVEKNKTEYVKKIRTIPPVIRSWDLGRGESGVLAYAYKNKGFKVVLDDKAARNCARALKVDLIGTIGLIILAARNGLVNNPEIYLRKLREEGYRINDALYNQAIYLINSI